jgi:hypothetical protein
LTLPLTLTEYAGFSPAYIYERARLRALSSKYEFDFKAFKDFKAFQAFQAFKDPKIPNPPLDHLQYNILKLKNLLKIRRGK